MVQKKYIFSFPKNEIKRILFIQLNFRGDLLFNTPLFHILNIYYNNPVIDVWVKSRSSEILRNNIYVNNVIIFDDIKTENYSGKTKFNIIGKIKFLSKIRKNKYDLILDFTGLYSTGIFTLLSKAKYTFGKNTHGFGFCYDKYDDIDTFHQKGHLMIKYQQIFKRAIGISDKEWINIFKSCEYKPEIFIDDSIKNSIDIEFKERKINQNKIIICIHLTAGWNAKRWSEIKYKELIEYLLERDIEFVFVGDDKDYEVYNLIKRQLKSEFQNIINNRFFKLSFLENAEVIKRANIFIGADSAPLHIASAVGTPTISLFGPTNPEFSTPLNNNIILYKKLNCSAPDNEQYCTRNAGKNCYTVDCMKMILVQDVIEGVNEILKNRNKKLS
jgi:ADP-heptose:LPS heptosyltransferase